MSSSTLRPAIFLALSVLLLTACGCDDVVVLTDDGGVLCSVLPDSRTFRATMGSKPHELPVVNLARAMREWNWGGGSCVHASNLMELRWTNLLQMADWWRKTYSGGESYNGLTAKLKKAKIPFYSTTDGEVDVLDRCTAERRGAVIFYYPNHSILFCGMDAEHAYVLDNNRIEEFIKIPRERFIKNWRGYGGVAIVPTAGFPRPPLPYVKR